MRTGTERLSNKSLVKGLTRLALRNHKNLMFQKLDNGRFKVYCPNSQRYKRISADKMKLISKTHICPDCYYEVIPTSKSIWTRSYMRYEQTGYCVTVWVDNGKQPKSSVVEVAHFIEGSPDIECRYIKRAMFVYSFDFNTSNGKWKIRKDLADTYDGYFTKIYYGHIETALMKKPYSKSSRKEYLNFVTDRFGTWKRAIKSNQATLFRDNFFHEKMIVFALAFDLKTPEEVYKYNGYYNKQLTGERWKWENSEAYRILNNIYTTKPLSIYYLDYLWRNKISLIDWEDYMNECKQLGFKLDKPTDFWHRHAVLDTMIEEKKNQKTCKSIAKQYHKLKKNTYTKGNITIKPFESYGEMILVGKKLHNCIGRLYTERYARGEVDLYHLDVDDVIVAAIEIKNGKLVQARIDNNYDCPAEYKKVINSMIKAKYKKGVKANA